MTDNVEDKTFHPEVLFAPGGAAAALEKIRAETPRPEIDLSTKAGRDVIASVAYKVATRKAPIEAAAKAHSEDLKARLNVITTEKKILIEGLDALRDEIRKPLDEWEEADAKRVAEIKVHLNDLISAAGGAASMSIEELESRIRAIENSNFTNWQEFADAAKHAKDGALLALNKALIDAMKRREEQAEEDRIKAEEDAKLKREQEEQRKKEAEQKAKDDAEAAAKAEEARIQREAEAKAADEQHRARVREAAVAALIDAGLDGIDAVMVVDAIDAGRIANVSIVY